MPDLNGRMRAFRAYMTDSTIAGGDPTVGKIQIPGSAPCVVMEIPTDVQVGVEMEFLAAMFQRLVPQAVNLTEIITDEVIDALIAFALRRLDAPENIELPTTDEFYVEARNVALAVLQGVTGGEADDEHQDGQGADASEAREP